MSFDFSEKLAFGEEGERLVASFLMGRGASVLPLYQYQSTRAPLVFSRRSRIIAPDLYVWRVGKDYHAECKRKTRWVRFTGQLETGLNKRHFNSYLELIERTNREVVCFFLHEREEPTGLYCGALRKLSASVRLWSGINCKTKKRVSKGMALFPINKLMKICSLDELDR